MKRLLLLAAGIVMIALQAASQVRFNAVLSPQLDVEPSLRAGIDADIPLSTKFFFMPGVYWSKRVYTEEYSYGPSDATVEHKFVDKADFIQIPLRFALGFKSTNDMYETRLMMGPYVACGLGGSTKDDLMIKGTDNDGNYKEHSVSHSYGGVFDKGGAWKTRWDVGLVIGADVYVHQHWLVGLFTEVGFVKGHRMRSAVGSVLDDIFLGTNKRNIAVGLSFGYRF